MWPHVSQSQGGFREIFECASFMTIFFFIAKKNQNGYFWSNPFNLLVVSSLVKSSILTEKYEENVKKCRHAGSTLQAIKRQGGEGMAFLKLEEKKNKPWREEF